MKLAKKIPGLILLFGLCSFAGVSNDELKKSCAQKIQVYDRVDGSVAKVGERIDGFCDGFIRASWAAYAKDLACRTENDNAEFLLSVYSIYVKTKKIPGDADASKTLLAAFSRIGSCN